MRDRTDRFIALTFVVAVAGAWLIAKRSPASVSESTSVQTVQPLALSAKGGQERVERSMASATAPAALSSGLGERIVADLRPKPGSLNEQVETYSRLRGKALRTDDEDRWMKRFRRTPSSVISALKEIQSTFENPEASGQEADTSNSQSIVLIQDALLDAEFPAREQLQALVEQVILADNLRSHFPRPTLRRLAADKGELILGYVSAQPERIEFLKSASAGTPNGRVVNNALAVIARAKGH